MYCRPSINIYHSNIVKVLIIVFSFIYSWKKYFHAGDYVFHEMGKPQVSKLLILGMGRSVAYFMKWAGLTKWAISFIGHKLYITCHSFFWYSSINNDIFYLLLK